MTASHLKNSLLFVILAVLLASCGETECIDSERSDHYKNIAKEWFVADSIKYREIVDDTGFSQTLLKVSCDTFIVEDACSDDCGTSYDRFMYSVGFRTSVSPYSFSVDISSGCITNWENKNQFTLKVTISNTISGTSQAATYDIVTNENIEKNASIKYFEDYPLDEELKGVLEITFNEISSFSDIKTVLYAKSNGIVMFVDGNGNRYMVR